MKLEETVKMMMSEDYKERFKAEYYQLLNRYIKLLDMVEKWEEDKLDFIPTCPLSTYVMQLDAMEAYLSVLEARAVMEKVDISPDLE